MLRTRLNLIVRVSFKHLRVVSETEWKSSGEGHVCEVSAEPCSKNIVGMFRARCNLIVRIRFSGLWIQWDIVWQVREGMAKIHVHSWVCCERKTCELVGMLRPRLNLIVRVSFKHLRVLSGTV